jgi:fructosamine-3-kinase
MITAGMVAAAASELLGESIGRESVTGFYGESKWRVPTKAGLAFIKALEADRHSPFPDEGAGLDELRRARAIRVPEVWAVGSAQSLSLIVSEWLELGENSAASDAMLGSQLAAQHRTTAERFGWRRENYLGASRQPNAWSDSWIDFFREQRLRYQLNLAAANAGRSDTGWIDRGLLLCDRVSTLLDHHPRASLLHGDLWRGNAGTTPDGQPVVFDPAVYFGDREADIAMTRLFGGFGGAFYSAYEECWPLDAGSEVRATLYNLYHVLNHFNMFGASYLRQARNMIEELLAETAG